MIIIIIIIIIIITVITMTMVIAIIILIAIMIINLNVVSTSVRMAERSKAPDSRIVEFLPVNHGLGVLVSEWRRGFKSHF